MIKPKNTDTVFAWINFSHVLELIGTKTTDTFATLVGHYEIWFLKCNVVWLAYVIENAVETNHQVISVFHAKFTAKIYHIYWQNRIAKYQ